MNNVYFGLNNVAEKPSKIYIGDSNGVARMVKKAYLGVNGVAKQVYSIEPEPIDDWDYTIDGNNVILNYYKFKLNPNPGYYYGDIVVYSTYTINGTVYNTKIASSPISTPSENFQDYYMFNKTGEYAGSKYADPNSITFEQGVDTSSCTSLAGMFRNVQVAQPISGWQYFDTSNVEDMGFIFTGSKLIENIENWDVSKVKYFFGAFLTIRNSAIDISGWDTRSAINMRRMFENNRNPRTLEHIYVGNGWNTSNVSQSTDMFKSCELLPNFNSNYVDKTRAYVGSGGYLERKS